MSVLDRIAAERERQDAKFGEQNYPWSIASVDPDLESPAGTWLPKSEEAIKRQVEGYFERGIGDWADILFEEVAEALNASGNEHTVEELIQVAAVCVAAVESIERNGR